MKKLELLKNNPQKHKEFLIDNFTFVDSFTITKEEYTGDNEILHFYIKRKME